MVRITVPFSIGAAGMVKYTGPAGLNFKEHESWYRNCYTECPYMGRSRESLQLSQFCVKMRTRPDTTRPDGLVRIAASLLTIERFVSRSEGCKQWAWSFPGVSSSVRPARRGEVLVEYGVSEYTLVFRRVKTKKNGRSGRFWVVARPSHGHVSLSTLGMARRGLRESSSAGVAPVFVVPICSTLGLDKSSYEAFLLSSGILDDALRLLSRLLLRNPNSVETTRKRIQSLIMAAEVQHIVDGMTA